MGVRRRYQKAAERQLRRLTLLEQTYAKNLDIAHQRGILDGLVAAYCIVECATFLGEVARGEWQ